LSALHQVTVVYLISSDYHPIHTHTHPNEPQAVVTDCHFDRSFIEGAFDVSDSKSVEQLHSSMEIWFGCVGKIFSLRHVRVCMFGNILCTHILLVHLIDAANGDHYFT